MGIDYVMQKEVEKTRKPMLAYTSRPPHRTWCLVLAYHEKRKPTKLITDLEAAGWSSKGPFFNPQTPACNGVVHLTISCPGTDIFTDWFPKEREQFMGKCRKVLEKHGYDAVPHYELTMVDCF